MQNIKGSSQPGKDSMRKFALVVGAVLGLCGSAFGQDVPRAEVFGGYSYLNIDTNGLSSRQSANGWEAAISGNFNNWFGVEGDVAGYYKTIAGVSVRDYSYAGGPRFNYRQLPSVTIFGHALLGGDHLTGSFAGLSASQDSFASAFGGGVQWRVAPQWAVRASGDYVLTHHNIFGSAGSSFTQSNFRASVGIVYVFGGRREASSGGRNQTTNVPIQTGPASEAALLDVSGYATDIGFKITSVRAGSPAAQIYLSPGDTIFQIDGRDVQSSHDIEAAIAASASGTVKVTFRNHEALGAKSEREVKVR